MKKSVIFLLAFVSMIALLSCVTYAEVIENVKFNPDNNTVKVEGTLPSSKEGQIVTVQLLQAGRLPEELMTAQAEEYVDILAYNGAVMTDADGNFEAVMSGKGESGICYVRVSYRYGDIYVCQIEYLSEDDAASLLTVLNTGSHSDIVRVISENGTALGIFPNVIESVGAQKIADSIIAERPRGGYSLIGNVAETVNALGLTESINNCSGADEARTIIMDNIRIFQDYVSFDIFKALEKEHQDFILSELIKADYKNGAELMNSFNEKTALFLLKNTVNYLEVGAVIERIESILGTEVSEYAALSNTTKVDKAICGNWYASLEELNAAVKQANQTENNDASASKPSGGGSGSGGGSQSTFTVADSTQYIQEDINKPVFTDIDDVAWAKEGITELYNRNIVSGDGNGNFRPNDNITREEFVKIIVLAYGLYDETAEADFEDVDKDSWYYKYIASAAKAGIISGKSITVFGTSEPITRQDLITIAYRTVSMFYKTDTYDKELAFDDVGDFDEYSVQAAAVMLDKKIINGVGENKFAPKSPATRAQVCKIVYGLLTYNW